MGIIRLVKGGHAIKHTMNLNMQKSYGSDLNLMNKALEFLKTTNLDDEWIRRTETTSFGKLLFNNGIIHGRTGVFEQKFDPSIVFRGRINRDYEEQTAEQKAYSEASPRACPRTNAGMPARARKPRPLA